MIEKRLIEKNREHKEENRKLETKLKVMETKINWLKPYLIEKEKDIAKRCVQHFKVQV